MDQRKRLIELLLKSDPLHERDLDDDLVDGEVEAIADHLLANGVIVPPCKIGDTVYVLSQKSIQEYTVHAIEINENSTTIKCYSWLAERESLLHKHIAYFGETDFGKIVFLTKAEAEKALAERSGG